MSSTDPRRESRVLVIACVAVRRTAALALALLALVACGLTLVVAGVEIGRATESLSQPDLALSHLVKAIDALLLASIEILLAFAMLQGLLPRKRLAELSGDEAMTLSDEHQGLKPVMLKAVVLILAVRFLEVVLVDPMALNWQNLVLPVSILLLAATIWVVRPSPE